jgi:hypothetical protein
MTFRHHPLASPSASRQRLWAAANSFESSHSATPISRRGDAAFHSEIKRLAEATQPGK